MSELEEDRKKKMEWIEARKHREDLPEQPLLDKATVASLKPKTFREKWDNYWYHYKWLTIGMAFVVFVVGGILWSFFFHEKYDTSFSIYTEYPFSNAQELLEPPLTQLAYDYDGNGKVTLDLQVYQIAGESNEQTMAPAVRQANSARLAANLGTGKYYLFLLDESGYENLVAQGGAFVDLASLFNSDKIEGDRYYLNGTKLMEELGISGNFSGYFISFLDIESFPEKTQKNKSVMEAHTNQWDYLKRVIALG